MKIKYLFPHRFNKIGWIVLIIGLIMGIYSLVNGFSETDGIYKYFKINFFVFWFDFPFQESKFFQFSRINIYNAVVGTLLIVGSLMVAFSKQKEEDEFIAKIRLESLVWATYVNYIVLLIAFIFVYGAPFFNVMLFNMFTILFFFIIRFNWELIKMKKAGNYEE